MAHKLQLKTLTNKIAQQMKLQVNLIQHTPNAERMLVLAKSTRLNMNSELIGKVWAMGDEELDKELDYIANSVPSSWEFVDYTWLIQGITRDCVKQMLRTRTYSAAEQSFRIGDHSSFDMMYLNPDIDFGLENPEQFEVKDEQTKCGIHICAVVHELLLVKYKKLLSLGFSPEEARCLIPGSAKTNLLLKANLRTFADVCKKRLGGRTQSEHRKVVQLMLDEVLKTHPWVEKFIYNKHNKNYFADIEAFAEREFGGDLLKKGELLKIVDKMRQA